ncbi:MAG: TIGR04013 family B12-binding domain/radical SAM domain-containing protein [Crenarchaeota archaeon]|nr:TIGR04013 family B12-binding domain/radical SAM domain-containing protein [Thermoproteota archaeon]
MTSSTALLLYRTRFTRYSVNVIAAVADLVEGVDVFILEKMRAEDSIELFDLVSRKYRYGVLALSLNTFSLVNDNFRIELERLIRIAKDKGLITLAGGPHPSGDPLGTLRVLGFDYAVIGEGEDTIREFLETLIDNGDLLRVKGLFTIYDNNVIYTGSRNRYVDLDRYPAFPYWRHLYNPIEITRGCPHGCKYCQVSYVFGRTMRHRCIDIIIKHVDTMMTDGLNDVRFVSPDSLSYGLKHYSREPALDVIEELFYRIYSVFRKHGRGKLYFGTFPSEVRPEHLTREAAKLLARYVSNKNIIMGAQSGSNRVLKLLGRGHTIEDVYEAVENAIQYGFRPDIDFIVGLPIEEDDDLHQTAEAIRRLVDLGARIHLHTFMPLPGTPYAYMEPKPIPKWFRREIMKIIGMGSGYGQWLKQEEIAKKIIELRRKGIILPRAAQISARHHHFFSPAIE